MRGTTSRLLALACAAGVGYLAGWGVTSLRHLRPRPENYPFLVEEVPLPHHVPEYRGGVSLRFAMVHDVLFERFSKHGPAHYEDRDRLTRAKLALLPPTIPPGYRCLTT